MKDLPNETDPHTQTILEARAQALAQPPPTAPAEDVMSLVVLALGAEKYGIDIRSVVEIQPAGPITRLPGVPPMWLGLTNLRGRLYPVLDLCHYLSLNRLPTPEATRRLVLVVGSGEAGVKEVGVKEDGFMEVGFMEVGFMEVGFMEVGFIVDDAPHVRQVSLSDLSAPLVESAGQSGVMMGITADLLTVLDVDKLLRDARLVVQDTFSQQVTE